MTQFTAKVYDNGRITIPIDVREKEEINDGDFIDLKVVNYES